MARGGNNAQTHHNVIVARSDLAADVVSSVPVDEPPVPSVELAPPAAPVESLDLISHK